jgi:hypothetical protein
LAHYFLRPRGAGDHEILSVIASTRVETMRSAHNCAIMEGMGIARFTVLAGRSLAIACLVVACGNSKSSFSAFDGGADSGVDSSTESGLPGCPSAQQLCGGKCVDTTSDPNNCGACGTSCDGGTCCASTCVEDTASCSFVVTGVSPTEGNQNGATGSSSAATDSRRA